MKFKLIIMSFILLCIWSAVAFRQVGRTCDSCKSESGHHREFHHHQRCHDKCKCHHKGPFDIIQKHPSNGWLKPPCANQHCQQCGSLFALPPPPPFDCNTPWGIFGSDHKKPGFLGLPIHLPVISKAGLCGYIGVPGQLGGFKVDLFKIDV